VVLEIGGLTKNFGGLVAIDNLELKVLRSEILGVIGPNGAGKTTLFNLICGFLRPTKGRIIFKGNDIIGLKPHKIAELGIGRTFQRTTLFMDSTVFENVLAGFHLAYKVDIIKTYLHTLESRKEAKLIKEKCAEILDLVGLVSLKDELAKNLSHGHQRSLGLGVALACNPALLLVDEPATGMNTQESQTMMNIVRGIRDTGITIMIIEHDMKVVMNLCDRIAALSFGQKIAEGLPEQIRQNKEVIEVYLGREEM